MKKTIVKQFTWFLMLWAFNISASFFVQADEAVPGAPSATVSSPATLDQSFLLLPSYDLERIGDGAIRVGDTIDFKIAGLPTSDIKSVEVPPGTEDLDESGWDVTLKMSTNGGPHLEADALKAGRLTLPSLALKDAADKALGRTNPVTLNVESSIAPNDPKKDEPADLQPPVSLSFPRWVILAAAALALSILSGVIYGFVRWSRKSRPPIVKVPEQLKPEDEVAFGLILELERSPLLERGDYKKYYFKVSEILKNYLGRRYSFEAPESTTSEMISIMRAQKIVPDFNLDQIEKIFLTMDVIKFTDTIPSVPDAKNILLAARSIVSQTRRVPVVIPPAISATGGPRAN